MLKRWTGSAWAVAGTNAVTASGITIQDDNVTISTPNFNLEILDSSGDPVLTMSAGVDFDEAYSSPFSPTTQLYYGDDLQEIAFGMKEIDEPGVNFIYQSGVTQLLGFIVEKATGEKLSDYVSRKLWTPMHAEESALWSLDRKDGMEKAYCCFNSNARDFARFGQLLLNNGQWDDRQLISPAYLAEATSPDTRLVYKDLGKPNHCYGFQYWILDYKGMKIPYMRGTP